MDNQTLWKTVLSRLEIDLSPANFKTWFSGTTIQGKVGSVIEIGCPTSFTKNRLEKFYQAQIKQIIDDLTGEPANLVFKVKSPAAAAEAGGGGKLGPLFTGEEIPTRELTTKAKQSNLFPQYTFADFVVGNNNNLAFAVAQAIAENPGQRHNPFFLYSKVGLGKTHLIQAIGNEILKKHPNLSVLYTTSENFTNQLIQAIQNRTTVSFKKRFRSVDVLLIDDIQFLAGRESSQEEFFHTFNTLFMEQRQIVLTSDRPLEEISKLEKRLSSRFGSGMMADMQAPDVDMRLAILQNKRRLLSLEVSDEVLAFIAEANPSNIRELEGALNRVITVAQTQKQSPSLAVAREVFGRLAKVEPPSPEKIINEVCTYYTLRPQEIMGKRRPARIVGPRQVAMYLLRSLVGMSLAEIGTYLGGRDHTTVIHGIAKIKKSLGEDSRLKEQIQVIKSQIGG